MKTFRIFVCCHNCLQCPTALHRTTPHHATPRSHCVGCLICSVPIFWSCVTYCLQLASTPAAVSASRSHKVDTYRCNFYATPPAIRRAFAATYRYAFVRSTICCNHPATSASLLALHFTQSITCVVSIQLPAGACHTAAEADRRTACQSFRGSSRSRANNSNNIDCHTKWSCASSCSAICYLPHACTVVRYTSLVVGVAIAATAAFVFAVVSRC